MNLPIQMTELAKHSIGFRQLCQRKDLYFVASDSTNFGYALKDLITHLERKAVRTADTSQELSVMKVQDASQGRPHITEQEYPISDPSCCFKELCWNFVHVRRRTRAVQEQSI